MAGETPKSSSAPVATKIRETSPTGGAANVINAVGALGAAALNTSKMDPDVRKAKGTDLGVAAVGSLIGASEGTQRNIKDLVLSDGKSKSAAVGLALSGIDKLTGSNLSGIYQLGQDLFDLFDPKSPVKVEGPRLPENSVLYKIRRRGDPLFSFDWNVELPNDLVQSLVQTIGLDISDLLNFYPEDVTVTPRNIQAEQVFRRGTMVNYPGWMDTGSLSITFYEDRRMLVTTFIDAWQRLVRTDEGFYNLPSAYKRPIKIQALDAEGTVAGTFDALGCWPTSRQAISFQSASSDLVKVTVDFATDGVLFTAESGWEFGSDDLILGNGGDKQEDASGGFLNLKSSNPLINKMLGYVNKSVNNSDVGKKITAASSAIKSFKP